MRMPFVKLAVLLLVMIAALPGCSNTSLTASKSDSNPTPTRFTVFASDRNRLAGYTRNVVTGLDVPGTAEFVLGSGSAIIDRHPSITADGNLLVYESSPGRGGSHDVFGFDRVSGNLTDDSDINTDSNETDPFISLDGRRLAFVRETLGKQRIRL